MASFTNYLQRVDGTSLTISGSTDSIWMTGPTWGTPVIISSYQDGTHVADVNNVQRDIAVPGNNTKYLTATTASVNAAASVALSTLTSGSAPLHVNFSHSASVSTSSAIFHWFDGFTASTPMAGITVQAAEVSPNFGGQSTNASWTIANGSGNALALAAQSANTSHDYFLAISCSPTSAVPLVGSCRVSLVYS